MSIKRISSTEYYIPSSLKSVTVTGGNILYGAFYNCWWLENITIGNSVTSIGDNAFLCCGGLTSMVIPDSVTSIGEGAFKYCTGLTNIVIPNSVTSIGKGAFNDCTSLESITIPFVGAKAGVTSSDTYQYPFGYIFGTYDYPGGVVTEQYYYGSSTSSTTYDRYCIPSSLKSVTVTGGNILYGAFYNCAGLESITIGDGVTSVDDGAFKGCSGLTSLTIGKGVESIAEGAFSTCTALSRISVAEGNAKYHSKNNCVIETESKTLVLGCKGSSMVPLDGSVTSIGAKAFAGCTGLEVIAIPESVTSIGDGAFDGCTALTVVAYTGTREQWAKISIGANNEWLEKAEVIFTNEML